MMLQNLTTKCQRLTNLKHDTTMITSSSCVHAINSSVSKKSDKKRDRKQSKPITSGWHCSEWRFARYCCFKRHKCSRCDRPTPSSAGTRKLFVLRTPLYRLFLAIHIPHPKHCPRLNEQHTSVVAVAADFPLR
ncbi:hypothetical protein T265_10840 [Opisthorchis viverrini]|uniref:Uncharacterized protein n=1 Tax=Opisthorchis viverrini TaxID=6198 RepID=A0A074Z153_OPIVI|nr:hypothetical protein T265_10840 [Opisthorchis viverrini]KER20668.1 hypothetical protein T265_10840 [Opisthorchis viverrini]